MTILLLETNRSTQLSLFLSSPSSIPVSPLLVHLVFESFVVSSHDRQRKEGREKVNRPSFTDRMMAGGKKEFQRLHHNESLLIDSVSFWVKKNESRFLTVRFSQHKKQGLWRCCMLIEGHRSMIQWQDQMWEERERTKSSNSISGPWSLTRCDVMWFNTRSFYSLCFLFFSGFLHHSLKTDRVNDLLVEFTRVSSLTSIDYGISWVTKNEWGEKKIR